MSSKKGFSSSRCILTTLALLSFVQGGSVKADDVYTFVIKKQAEKASSKWSIADWLDTRDRMRLQDVWLSLHSPSPFEFILGVDYQMADTDPSGRGTSLRLSAAAYAQAFGLEVQKGLGLEPEWVGLFNLRFFGYQAQGTNLTLQLGMRSSQFQLPSSFSERNALAGLSMNLYLTRFFGIQGLYRHNFSSIPNQTGQTLSGTHLEGGAFIDFQFLRVYGAYYSLSETLDTSSASAPLKRSGVLLGTRLYF